MNRVMSKLCIALSVWITASFSTAQNIPSFKPVQNVLVGKTTFLFLGDRILSKRTARGWTIYVFDNKRLVKEQGPGGVTGTYVYGPNDRLEHIVYSNGRTIAATYTQAGELK